MPPTEINLEKCWRVTTKKVIRKLRKNSCSFQVEILDTPLRKRDRGGCLLKRILVVGLTGIFGGRDSPRLAAALHKHGAYLRLEATSNVIVGRTSSII